MSSLEAFHFLRPAWLLALLPIGLMTLYLMRARQDAHGWKRLVAPHLLSHLLVQADVTAHRARPGLWFGITGALACFALAGPVWETQPTPFAREDAGLVVVLALTPSMLTQDLEPSRLARATQKIQSLLAAHPTRPTALLVYAGSAHRVMPLTRDTTVVSELLGTLRPDLMPVQDGNASLAALDLALDQLEQHTAAGSILLVADALASPSAEAASRLTARARRLGTGLHILATAAPPGGSPMSAGPAAPALDRDAFQAAASALDADLTEITIDGRDLEHLERGLRRSLTAVRSDDTRWIDRGYAVTWLVALCLLPCFRRGWRIAA